MTETKKSDLLARVRALGQDGQSEDELQRLVFDELGYEEIEELHEQLTAEFAAGWTERKAKLWTVWYTTAVRDYDGFGTTEVVACAAMHCGKKVRKVAIHPDHVVWQSLRYLSGSEMSADQADFDKLVGFGLFEVVKG